MTECNHYGPCPVLAEEIRRANRLTDELRAMEELLTEMDRYLDRGAIHTDSRLHNLVKLRLDDLLAGRLQRGGAI